MTNFDITQERRQFEASLDGKARSAQQQRASIVTPLAEQLRAAVPGELYAAADEARRRLREAQEDVRAAEGRAQALQVAQVPREEVPQLVRDRAQAAGELLEYRRLAEQAQTALTRSEATLAAAAQAIVQGWQREKWAAFQAGQQAATAQTEDIKREAEEKIREAWKPVEALAAELAALRLLAEEVGGDPGPRITQREVIKPATGVPLEAA